LELMIDEIIETSDRYIITDNSKQIYVYLK